MDRVNGPVGTRRNGGLLAIDPAKLKRQMQVQKESVTSLADNCRVARNTIYRMLEGKAVRWESIEDVCTTLKIPSKAILPGSEFHEIEAAYGLTSPQNWHIAKVLGPWRTTPNKLSYRLVKLQNTLIEDRYARAKFYDLVHVPPDLRREMRDLLVRHPLVCERLRDHDHILRHLDVRPLEHETGWWILDEWIEGESLEDSFVENPAEEISDESIRNIGTAILSGLAVLHQAGVIFRDLAPDKVWRFRDGEKIVLTDFELAKLTDGSPSVSGLWSPDYFRAAEVSEYYAYPQSDLYSFAKVIVWLLHGGKPIDSNRLDDDRIPPNVAECLNRCLAVRYSKRPKSADQVAQVWREWK